MTREKYESLPLSTLKALAKSRNMKGISTLRKEALIERMLEEDQKENQRAHRVDSSLISRPSGDAATTP